MRGQSRKGVETLFSKEKTSWEIRKVNVLLGKHIFFLVCSSFFLWRFLAKTEGNFLLIVWVEFICQVCDIEPSFGIFSWESFLIVIKTRSHSPYSSYSCQVSLLFFPLGLFSIYLLKQVHWEHLILLGIPGFQWKIATKNPVGFNDRERHGISGQII